MSFESNLRNVVQEAMERLSVPGVAVGITTPSGREILSMGVTALDTQFNVRDDTLFQVGSVSKPFAATLVMALVESGDIDLDVPISTYVPELRLGAQRVVEHITLRHLLTHQAGFWGDWFDDFGLADNAIDRFVGEYGHLPQLFEPGTMWAYNNCGYILAGLAAARAAGKTYEAALQETVLNPLGMDHTVLSAAEAIAYPVAVGHTNAPEDGKAQIARQFLRPRARNPAGGVLASVEDVLTFADLHLGRETGIISSEAIEAMHTPAVPTFEVGASWGLGFKIEQVNGGILVGHGGATNGFRAQLEMIPEQGFGVGILTNSDSGGRLATEVAAWILEERLDLTMPTYPTHDLPAEAAVEVSGAYRQPYATIDIGQGEATMSGRITAHSPYSENSEPHTGPWFGLRYIGDDRFIVEGGELKDSQIKFWKNEDGTIRFLQAGGRLYVPGSWQGLEGASAE